VLTDFRVYLKTFLLMSYIYYRLGMLRLILTATLPIYFNASLCFTNNKCLSKKQLRFTVEQQSLTTSFKRPCLQWLYRFFCWESSGDFTTFWQIFTRWMNSLTYLFSLVRLDRCRNTDELFSRRIVSRVQTLPSAHSGRTDRKIHFRRTAQV